MRWLGRALIVVLACLLAWFVSPYFSGFFQREHLDLTTPYPEIPADRIDVYRLNPIKGNPDELNTERAEHRLSFRLDQTIDRLQITSMALLSAADYPAPVQLNIAEHEEHQAPSLPPYKLTYRLVDNDGDILYAQTYWLQTRPVNWLNWKNKYPVPELFVSDSGHHLSERQAIFLRLDAWPEARELQLELVDPPEQVKGAVVYVQQRSSRDQEEITQLWRKLSEPKRAELTNDKHIYPHYLWSNTEIETLLAKQWLRVGPNGIVGQDFQTLGLYHVEDLATQIITEQVGPERADRTLWVAKDKRLTFPVYEKGHVALRLRQFDAARAGALLHLRWHSAGTEPPIDMQVRLEQETVNWHTELAPGLLELWSDQVIEVERTDMPDPSSMTHDWHFSRLFLLSPDKPLDYAIHHQTGSSTPIRIELRAFKDAANMFTEAPAEVSAHWFSEDEERDRSHYALALEPSVYERLADDRVSSASEQHQHVVSVPVYGFYRAPAKLDRLRLRSNTPVLVQVSSRPPNLPLFRALPRHSRNWFDDESFIASWFSIRPEGYQRIMSENASRLLVVQHRPLAEQAEDPNEEKVGDVLHPMEKRANLVQMLLPKATLAQVSEQSPQRVFHRIDASGSKAVSTKLNFIKERFSPSVKPSLVFLRDTEQGQEVTVTLDQQVLVNKWVGGKWGKLALPAVRSGSRAMRIKSDEAAWYVNMLSPDTMTQKPSTALSAETAPYLLATEGYQLHRDMPLNYQVDKTSQLSILHFTFFRDALRSGRMDKTDQQTPAQETAIEVKLLSRLPDGAYPGLTLPERRWVLAAPESPELAGWLLHQGSKRIDAGQSFVFALAEDLPEGTYQLQVKVLSGPSGLLRVTRSIPQEAVDIDYYREPVYAY